MFRYIITGLVFFSSLFSYSQSAKSIKKISAFYMVKMPGNIPVDENGRSLFKGPDTLITIYVEVTGKGPEWKTAWRNDKSYTVYASLISQTPYEAGIKVADEKKVILKPASGNSLWKLSLQREDKPTKRPQKIKPGEILLGGKYGSKTIYTKTGSIIQLTAIPSV